MGKLAKRKLPPLGSGTRFKAITNKMMGKPGIKNPAAVAAAIGRKKYGAKKMAQLSAGGKRNV